MANNAKRYKAAAVLAVLAVSVNLGYCGDGMGEMKAGSADFESLDIKEMMGAQRLEIAVPQAQAAAPEAAPARDIFTEIKACNAVDRVFAKRPTTEEALRMLAPCMKGVTKLYGNNVYAESTIMNPDNIQIVVLDSVTGKTIVEDLTAALAKRHGGLFGHKVTLSVMDVSARTAAVSDCRDVGAMVETDARISARFALSRLVEGSAEYRLAVPDGEKGMRCERMGNGVLRMTVFAKLASPAFEFSAPAPSKNGRRAHWDAPVYPPNRKIIERAVYLYDVEKGEIIGSEITTAGN